MFLRSFIRRKDGKEHRYWSIVENRRIGRKRIAQKTVLYLGEINDAQQFGWLRAIETVEGDHRRQLFLFPADRQPPLECDAVQIKMKQLELLRPRQWGGCWLGLELWNQLRLDEFWGGRLLGSREGTSWLNVLKTLTVYRFLDPGSEWRLHRLWYERNAMADLLGEDFRLAQKNTLYRCLDKLPEHKAALFTHLKQRWSDLFGIKYDVLLYDLTSTYFESDPPFAGDDKRKFGYSRDKRSDCVQVVIALIITPEGFPLTYEVLAGNTADKTTLQDFLKKIEKQYGKAERIWVMDRGIPTEEALTDMRKNDPPIRYLVGTPKGRLSKLEDRLVKLPWRQVRDDVAVKLLADGNELYVLAKSKRRIYKERSIRHRQLKKLWERLKELQGMKLSHDNLLIKLGAAYKQSPAAYRLVEIKVEGKALKFQLRKDRIREILRREGRYLLRTNLSADDPEKLWQMYIQLVKIEEAFRNLKGDLALRPIFHQNLERIEAHIFVSFLAYCLHVTLSERLKGHAPGLTPRSVLEQMKTIQMLDVRVPTTDGRWLHMSRYTQPDKLQQLLLAQLHLHLPAQPPPTISKQKMTQQLRCSEDFLEA